MPNTATRNIDAVIDGQLYIGKYVLSNRRQFFASFSLMHTFPILQSRRSQVHRPPPTIWHHAPRVCVPGRSSGRSQPLDYTRARL
jgi:hypothetical protein